MAPKRNQSTPTDSNKSAKKAEVKPKIAEEEIEFDDSIGKKVSLYVARWPSGDFSLLSAKNLTNAHQILDELGDPGSAVISMYNGPLFFDFTHKVQPFTNGDTAMENLEQKIREDRKNSLHKMFQSLYEKGKEFDMTIRFTDYKTGNEGFVRAHKIFLCGHSNYFAKYIEKNENVQEITLDASLQLTEDHLIYLLDTLYIGYPKGNSSDDLTFLLDIIKLSIHLECETMKVKAGRSILSKVERGYSDYTIVARLLEIANSDESMTAFFKAIASVVCKDCEKLKKAGLNSAIYERLTKWNKRNDFYVWAKDEDLDHEFILSESTASPADGYEMWKQLVKQVFPKSCKHCGEDMDPSLFKKALLAEIDVGKAQAKEAKQNNPQDAAIMNHLDISSIELLNFYKRIGEKMFK